MNVTSARSSLGWLLILAVLGAISGCGNRTDASAEQPDKSYVPKLNDVPPPGPVPEGMVWVPGGEFWMGTDLPQSMDARPIHLVKLDGFWIDKSTVTNQQFARFVAATGYVTIAERKPTWEEIKKQMPPGTEKPPDENFVPGSIVFAPPPGPVSLDQGAYGWSRYVPGACWKHPEGPDSDIKGREKHPVVHVCWPDAEAYCKWANKRLPTEAEWEFAARGGLDRKRYPWGDELKPGGKWMANIWQGHFPDDNTAEDGYKGTAPVGSFPANGYGLHDMAGNVWQWCADWYRTDYYQPRVTVNPQGPADSYDPNEPTFPKRVQRGGSFLCSDQYCIRYVVGTRGKGEVTSAASHVGFRGVRSAK